jgi:hypothetical protein
MTQRISASSRMTLVSSRWMIAVSTFTSSRRLASSASLRSCWRAKNSNVTGSRSLISARSQLRISARIVSSASIRPRDAGGEQFVSGALAAAATER